MKETFDITILPLATIGLESTSAECAANTIVEGNGNASLRRSLTIIVSESPNLAVGRQTVPAKMLLTEKPPMSGKLPDLETPLDVTPV
jgi:hypothetical protein